MIYYFGNQSGDTTRWFVIRFVIRRGCITHRIYVKSGIKTQFYVMKSKILYVKRIQKSGSNQIRLIGGLEALFQATFCTLGDFV